MVRSRLFAVLLSLSPAAAAADWVTVSQYSGMKLELDPVSVARDGTIVTAWDRISYSADRHTADSGDIAFRTAKTLMQYDCARRTVVPLMRSFAQEDGVEIVRQNVEGAELPQTVVPDTPREKMLRMVCKGVSLAAKPPRPVAVAAGPAEAGGGKAASPKSPPGTGDKPAEGKAGEARPAQAKGAGEKKEPAAAPAPAKGAEAAPKTAAGKADAPAAPAGKTAAKPEAAPAKAPPEAPAKEAAAKAAPGAKGHGEGKAADAKPPEKPDAHAKADGHGKSGHGDAKAEKSGKAEEHDKAAAEAAEKKAPVHTVHWSYSGQAGVQNWHRLSKEFAACAEGRRQSPIDIREGVRVQLDALKFDYRASPLRVLNSGHSIQVGYAPGSSILVGDTPYELVQFHFHRPSETRVNGRLFDMEAHLVHRAKDGKLAVVAVLMMIGDENPFIKALWNYLPLDVGLEESLSTVSIDAAQMLPKMRGYYTYMGSLTTPPCTEGVRWIVMRTPVQVSRLQVTTFGRLYDNNARPLQASNGRLIKEVL